MASYHNIFSLSSPTLPSTSTSLSFPKHQVQLTRVIHHTQKTKVYLGEIEKVKSLKEPKDEKTNLKKHSQVAIKTLYTPRKYLKGADKCLEIQIHGELSRHKNIVKLHESYYDHRKQCFYMMMDYVETDLLSYVNNSAQRAEKSGSLHVGVHYNLAKKIFFQLIETLQFIHKNLIVHGDIKLENILFDVINCEIKISDFGNSRKVSSPEDKVTGLLSSPSYCAPECYYYYKEGYNGFLSDIYSVGVVFYALLFGCLPFHDDGGRQYYSHLYKVCDKNSTNRPDLRFYQHSFVNNDLKSLLTSVLCIYPSKRLSLENVFQHPWITSQTPQVNNSISNKEQAFIGKKAYEKIFSATRRLFGLSLNR